jgi:hypothetical protein
MWLEECVEFTNFAIIDDLDSACIKTHKSHFFKTDPNIGLTVEIADKIIEHLKS